MGQVTFDHKEPMFHTITKLGVIGFLGYFAVTELAMPGIEHWNAASDAQVKLDAFLGDEHNRATMTVDAYNAKRAELSAPIVNENWKAFKHLAPIPALIWSMYVIRPGKKTTAYQYGDGTLSWW